MAKVARGRENKGCLLGRQRMSLSRMHKPRNRDKAKEANGAGQRGSHRPCEELGLL